MKDKKSYQIGVIGAGAWGTALANIVAKKEKVILYAKKVQQQSNKYKKQLDACKNSLTTRKYIIF